MTTIISLVFGLAFFILAYRRLDWAFFATLATLPAYLLRFEIGPLPSTILEVMIIATFAAWFIHNFPGIKAAIRGKSQRQAYPFALETILVLIISFLALIPSNFSLSALGIWRAYFFEPLLLFIVAANLFSKKENRQNFIYALATSALATAILAIYQKFTGDLIANPFWSDLATRRVTAWFPYPNALGLFLAPITAIISVFAIKEIEGKSYWKAGIYSCISLLSLAAIYFAKSDGAIIGLLGGAFVTALAYRPWSRKAAIVLTIVILEVVWLSPYKQAVIDKVTLFDLSGQIRQQQWTETWQMMKNDNVWLWGTGLDNYQKKISPYHQDGIFVENHDPDWYNKVVWDDAYKAKVWQPVEIYKYPHNIFLNFWTELGLLGLLLFIWLFTKLIYQAIAIWKNKTNPENRYYGLAILAAATAIIIHGLVDVPYFKNDLAAGFWTLLALSGIVRMDNLKVWKKE